MCSRILEGLFGSIFLGGGGCGEHGPKKTDSFFQGFLGGEDGAKKTNYSVPGSFFWGGMGKMGPRRQTLSFQDF